MQNKNRIKKKSGNNRLATKKNLKSLFGTFVLKPLIFAIAQLLLQRHFSTNESIAACAKRFFLFMWSVWVKITNRC